MPKTGKTFDEEHEPQTDITSLLARTLAALTSDRSQTTISPVPPPEKFRLGDDFDRWEQRVRDYLEAWEPSRRRYILLSLMDDDVYDQVFRDLPPGEVTEDTYRVLRSILVPPRPMKERRDAFRYRVQRNDETARQFATALRRLAPLAYPQFDAETLDHLTLCQFVDGVRSDAALASFAEQPPRTLSEAIDRACLKETPPTERLPEPPRDAVPTSTKRSDYSPEHHRRRQRQHWNPRKQRWNGSGNTGRTLTSESEPTPIYLSPISTINSCTLPLISGTINGVHSTILIDTGSACSLVRQAPHLSQPSFPVHRRLWAANNTEVLTLGMVQIEVKMGKINIEQEAVVVPQLRWDAILGADFLDRHACIIDLGKGSLRLKGEDITFRTPMQLKLSREIEVCSAVSDTGRTLMN